MNTSRKPVEQRGFRDRDFLSTKEGLLFCVAGPIHPTDRVISYLKYLPEQTGRWRKGKNRFKRVMRVYTIPNLLETFDLLKTTYSQYLYDASEYNITISAVPTGNIVKHFKPEEKMMELSTSSIDRLQRKVVDLVSSLSQLSKIPVENFGVTGSILLDIHSPTLSDIDVTVYGIESSYAVKKALTEKHLHNTDLGIKSFDRRRILEWCRSKTQKHPLSLREAKRICRRKWNIGYFNDTPFSVHPVKLEEEVTEKYGDKTYHPVGAVTVKAVVADSRDSIFLPSIYQVEDVVFIDPAETKAEIKEIVSYEGLYDSLGEKGETVSARGKLEHVVDNRKGTEYDRVLVGSPEGRGREYIVPATS